MKFHFSYFKTFFWGPTSTFYPHKVPFLTVVSFSGFEKAKVKSIPRVLKTGYPDLLPIVKSPADCDVIMAQFRPKVVLQLKCSESHSKMREALYSGVVI